MKLATAALTAALLAPTPIGISGNSDAAIPVSATHAVDPRTYVQQRASRSGWRGQQWRCLSAILFMESRWNIRANNGNHYGLFQEHNLKPGTDLATQTRRGLRYIAERYGTPCNALTFHLKHGWY